MMLVGLGIGIDYALLIFARFRFELLRGRTPRSATVVALDAAGRSVFVAGCTVIVALLGLVVLGQRRRGRADVRHRHPHQSVLSRKGEAFMLRSRRSRDAACGR